MFAEMRLKENQTSPEEARRIMRDCQNGTLALTLKNGYPYSVPLSYVFEDDVIYFHGAVAGQKYEALRENPKVCFSAVEKDEIQPGEFNTLFRSAIAFGRAGIVEDEAEIRRILHLIVQKYDPGASLESERTYTQKSLGQFCVFKIKVEHITGKQGT